MCLCSAGVTNCRFSTRLSRSSPLMWWMAMPSGIGPWCISHTRRCSRTVRPFTRQTFGRRRPGCPYPATLPPSPFRVRAENKLKESSRLLRVPKTNREFCQVPMHVGLRSAERATFAHVANGRAARRSLRLGLPSRPLGQRGRPFRGPLPDWFAVVRHDDLASIGQRLDRGQVHRHNRPPPRQVERYRVDVDNRDFRLHTASLHGPPNIELLLLNISC